MKDVVFNALALTCLLAIQVKQVNSTHPDQLMKGTETNQESPLKRFSYTELHMGGEFIFTFYASSQDEADKAARDAYNRIAELEQIMSDYRPSSEVRQLKAGMRNKVSTELFEILQVANSISKSTQGAFDVTSGPAIKIWRNARQTKRLPGPIELIQAQKSIGYWKLTLDSLSSTVQFTDSNLAIDLGGIAKGYACDEAMRVLQAHQISSALIKAGGDIAISQAPPETQGWLVQIPGEPTPRLFTDCAISTSGDTEQFVEIGRIRYSHIVDPRTGMGLTNRVMTTVIAKKGIISDPLATAICVLGQESVVQLSKQYNAKIFVLSNSSQPEGASSSSR